MKRFLKGLFLLNKCHLFVTRFLYHYLCGIVLQLAVFFIVEKHTVTYEFFPRQQLIKGLEAVASNFYTSRWVFLRCFIVILM